MKNYVGFVNDHSGSMQLLAKTAINDYNANITATKEAATREMLDTVVSVVALGFPKNREITRQVVISNPHVLKPITTWSTEGGTPLYDAIGNIIELFESLPDADSDNVSFLVIVTTDGEEAHSIKYSRADLTNKIHALQASGRWTFVFRVPKGASRWVTGLGVPFDNIQEWETSESGMRASTVQTTTSMNSFYTMRSAGAKSSSTFYSDAKKVNTSALVDITNKASLYVVDGYSVTEGMWIRDFVLTKRANYLKGAAFYQLTKTEPKIGEKKMIAVRERATGKIYGGVQAREMIGLPKFGNARLHPGDHKNYDIFIQSESVNRKLVKGTGLLYWEELGVPFTHEELERYLSPVPIVKPVVVQLPAVPVSNKPTPSPIPIVKQVKAPVGPTLDGKPVQVFKFREQARVQARANKVSVIDLKLHGNTPKSGIGNFDRWAVYI